MKFTNLIGLVVMSVIASGTWAQGLESAAEPTGTVILNNNNNNNNNAASSAAAVAQPTTIVEAAPVAPSKADLLRKSRLNAEVQTEQRVVEKIEDSRLQDEQRRAERLFGDRLNSNENVNINSNTATAVVVAPVAQAPVVAVAPVAPIAPVVVAPVVPAPVVAHEVTEVREEIAEHKLEHLWDKFERSFVGLGVGSSVYNADNVDTSYSLGVTAGMITAGNVSVEGLFNYSIHNIATYWQNALYRQMSQYDFGIGMKYYLTRSWTVLPYIGAQMIYSYRVYTDRVLDYCAAYAGCNPLLTQESTNALDLGWSAGMDVAISPDFLIGLDLNYNYNFVTQSDINYANYGVPVNVVPLEEISYYTLQVTTKMTF